MKQKKKKKGKGHMPIPLKEKEEVLLPQKKEGLRDCANRAVPITLKILLSSDK